MPIRSVPGTDLQYYLVSYDKSGNERPDPDAGGGMLSAEIKKALSDGTVTDVFVLSHGWKGDVPAAISQYDRWIAAMAQCERDRQRARQRWPKFKPLIIGFHWPSQPFGDEKVDGSFAAEAAGGEEGFVNSWADRIADTPAARQALKVIFDSALEDIEPERLPPEVVAAYKTLEKEAELGAEGVGGPPDADREPLDPQLTYEEASLEEEAAFGGGLGDGLLSPLRQLSFWTMKKRARHVGERGGHDLLKLVRSTSPNVRLHLMGHSFGCIVVSSMMRGRDGAADVPVASAMLVQGAMSLWSYCQDIPEKRGTAGYFWPVVTKSVVQGPLVVTTSRFDAAVGTWYPRAAAPARQVDFDTTTKLPKYGAIGTFGINGPGLTLEKGDIKDVNFDYKLAPGHIYNLRGDDVIKTGGGFSGAHSDIAHPEVGHAFWEAVLAAPGT